MSKPREYYYGDIKKWIMRKDKLPESRLQVNVLLSAFDEAMAQTAKLDNGELRLKAIEDILINKTKTYIGVAQEIHYDWRTVQNWVTSFVNLVGQLAGF